MFMIVLVVDDPNKCIDIMEAWDKFGVPGATVLDSVGLQRELESGARDDVSLLPSLAELFKRTEIRHRTVFSVVPDREMVNQIAAITQEIIGDFKEEHTGFMFTIKVEDVFGLRLP